MIMQFLSKNWMPLAVLVWGILVVYGSIIILGNNNPIEIAVEKIVQQETGIEIDLIKN